MLRIGALVLGVILIFGGGRATACMNDEESPSDEQEFRSAYGGLAGFPVSEDSGVRRPAPLDLLMGVGAIMLAGATGLIARRAGKRD